MFTDHNDYINARKYSFITHRQQQFVRQYFLPFCILDNIDFVFPKSLMNLGCFKISYFLSVQKRAVLIMVDVTVYVKTHLLESSAVVPKATNCKLMEGLVEVSLAKYSRQEKKFCGKKRILRFIIQKVNRCGIFLFLC